MTVPEPEEERIFCQYCRSPLDTDFEKEKESHWDCHDVIKTDSVIREVEPNLITAISENLGGHTTPLLTYKPVRLIAQANDGVIDMARQKWGLSFQGIYPTHEIGMSSLRPSHLYSVHGSWYGSDPILHEHEWSCFIERPYEWVNYISTEVSENYFLVVLGIFIIGMTDITEIKFMASGIDLPIFEISQINNINEKRLWFAKPFSIAPQNHISMKVFSCKRGIQHLGLMGHIVGHRSELIRE